MRALLSLAIVFALACSSDSSSVEPDPQTLLWTEACVRLSGCEPYASTSNPVSTCWANGWSFTVGTEPAECTLEATACETAVACFGAGSAPVECMGADSRCDGDVLRECDSSGALEVARDCAADGLSCRLNDFGDAHCAREGSCEAGSCDGDVPIHCFGGVPVPWAPCAPGRCVDDEGFVGCAGEGEACESPVFRCDGDVAVSCRDGFIHREQCRPGACTTDDGARCLTTEECTPHCEGTSVVQCVGGRVQQYDCTAWGFEGCAADGATASCI
jgi:hypothetical protein